MKEWQSQAHVKWECKYHVVFVPKYRHKVFFGRLRVRIGGILRELCRQKAIEVLEGHAMPDHIHMLVAAPPQLSPSKLVQFMKGRSSRLLQREFPALRKRYWGQHLWARGYYCASVGAVDEQTIRAYIESQRWDEDVDGFKITAPTEP